MCRPGRGSPLRPWQPMIPHICMYASVPEKKKHHEPVVQTAQDPCGLACPASRAMVCGQTELFWGRMPFTLNEADDDNEIPYRTQSRCNLSVNMKGPGGGPQVRFRNDPADLFRELRAEAKIDRQQQRYCLSGAQAIRRRTLYRLRAIMWPWNNIMMLQWCGTLMARSMCVLRPPKVRGRHSILWSAIWTGTCCTVPRDIDASGRKGKTQEQKNGLSHRKRRGCRHLTGQMRGTERCIVKVTPRWVGRFPTGCTNHIVNNGSSSFLRRIPRTPDAEQLFYFIFVTLCLTNPRPTFCLDSSAWPSQATQFAPTVSPFSLFPCRRGECQ